MKNLRDTMKQLQKASESLSKLSYDHAQPWNTLSHMQKVLDTNFWENLVELSRHSSGENMTKASEIVPTIKKGKKGGKEKPKAKKPEAKKQEEKGRSPVVDIFQTAEYVIVCCEVPGFERDSLEVTLTDQRILEVEGTVKEHPHAQSRVYSERTHGSFYRRIRLPATVSSKGMTVQYQDGILELKLVKDSQMREQKTTIRASL